MTNDNGFLPPDYRPPESAGKYLRFKDAETRFRVLSPTPLMGNVGWTTRDGKPCPLRKANGENWNLNELRDQKPPRHFWALAVWGYAVKRIQVLEITQSTIQKAIASLAKDADYGHPTGYDIVVRRTGEGMDTEYQVIPKPPKKVEKDIAAAWESLQDRFDLTRLMSGGDPFGDDMSAGNGSGYDELNPPPIGDDDLPF